ncbi:MAG: HNH endonuclease [Pseudomonadota bacterium]
MPKLKTLRALALSKQGGLCYYCAEPMLPSDGGRPVGRRCTAEHLQARRAGGKNHASNVVAACFACNQGRHRRKGDLSPSQWKAKIERRRAPVVQPHSASQTPPQSRSLP